MSLIVRTAQISDAKPMTALINKIIAKGGTTAHRRPFDVNSMTAIYIEPAHGVHCAVAVDGLDIVGFQALEWSDPNWPGPDALPADWGVIATYVAVGHHGQGIGRALFTATLAAARTADVRCIDATIRCENAGGRRYYDRMGFVDYRKGEGTISKRLDIARKPALPA